MTDLDRQRHMKAVREVQFQAYARLHRLVFVERRDVTQDDLVSIAQTLALRYQSSIEPDEVVSLVAGQLEIIQIELDLSHYAANRA